MSIFEEYGAFKGLDPNTFGVAVHLRFSVLVPRKCCFELSFHVTNPLLAMYHHCGLFWVSQYLGHLPLAIHRVATLDLQLGIRILG